MLFILPIQKLVITDILKLNDIILIPHSYFFDADIDDYEKALAAVGVKDISKALGEAWHYCRKDFCDVNVTAAVCEFPFTEKQYHYNCPTEDFVVLDKLSDYIDKSLDYLRLCYSNFNDSRTMPDFPGTLKGFKRGVVFNNENSQCRSILGEISNTFSSEGIGMLIEETSEEIINDHFYDIVFSNRQDEIYLNCRSALRRINQSFYFNNLEVQFIYLMSTIEMLASLDFLKFKYVKAKIIPFIASDKKEYHELSERYRYLSEDVRTKVVHCGKSLLDTIGDNKEIEKIVRQLIFHIVKYCEAVINAEIGNFEDLEKERSNRKINLGIVDTN